ncbi:histone-like nucleoid-structuring protein Lsr2 [Micromonospora pisi]|nr:Lsr2 family protein [Micromonospora pisi]
MSRQIITVITDDLDGTEGAETVHFAFEGREYRIDLSDHNRRRLLARLEPYINAGLPVRGDRTAQAPAQDRARRAQLRKMRDWWNTNHTALGLPEPKGYGRIPAKVEEAYRVHGNRQVPVVARPVEPVVPRLRVVPPIPEATFAAG